MSHIRSEKISMDTCRKLALLNITTRRGTPIESDKTIDEVAKNIEDISSNDAFRILTAFDDNEEPVGWIYYYIAFPPMTFINGFYPVVAETADSEMIAMELIETAKRDIIKQNHSRLEIELLFPTEEHRAYSSRLIDWYRKCGFQFAAEEIHMKSDLKSAQLPVRDLPEGYTLRKFSEVPFEIIEGPAFRTLLDSKEDLFLSQSKPEQDVTIRYFFDKSRPYIDDASLLLEKEGDIIGFVITHVGDDDEPDIGPVGLVP
ncbi:MAG: hypothetical protein ACFFFK_09695, partial [Candidatus Thorarchaeota archaeon]